MVPVGRSSSDQYGVQYDVVAGTRSRQRQNPSMGFIFILLCKELLKLNLSLFKEGMLGNHFQVRKGKFHFFTLFRVPITRKKKRGD